MNYYWLIQYRDNFDHYELLQNFYKSDQCVKEELPTNKSKIIQQSTINHKELKVKELKTKTQPTISNQDELNSKYKFTNEQLVLNSKDWKLLLKSRNLRSIKLPSCIKEKRSKLRVKYKRQNKKNKNKVDINEIHKFVSNLNSLVKNIIKN